MGKLLFLGTFATDDPTRASMPFIVASGALDKGHQPMIVLMGEVGNELILLASSRQTALFWHNLSSPNK